MGTRVGSEVGLLLDYAEGFDIGPLVGFDVGFGQGIRMVCEYVVFKWLKIS